jgi:hypothetical protein
VAAKNNGTRTTMRRRRTKEEINALDAELQRIVVTFRPVTVRQVFYQAVNRGLVPKSESTGYRVVQRRLCVLREVGSILHGHIVDGTRYVHGHTRHRQQRRMAELLMQQQAGDKDPLLAANIKQTEDRLDELNVRLERRTEELRKERNCAIGDIRHHGRAWILPHPERTSPGISSMVRDEEVERIAVDAAIVHEEVRGWDVKSVEKENRGFDLVSRKLHPEDPQTAMDVRFIEVKGRATVGEVALSSNEYKTAERLKKDYWLYVVFNCATAPQVHVIRDPARLGWEPVRVVEHYHVEANEIIEASR